MWGCSRLRIWCFWLFMGRRARWNKKTSTAISHKFKIWISFLICTITFGSNTKLRHWKGTKKELFRFYWCHSGGSGYKVWKVRKKYVFTAGLVWYDHGDNNVWYKNLRKWKFHWQVDRRNYKHYDGVPSFLEWIRRNLFSLSNVGEFMMRVHHIMMNGKKFMMGVHHMMQVHHMMRVYHMYDGYSSYITYS